MAHYIEDIIEDFEKNVVDGLKNCGVSFSATPVSIGAAVSGGADSISLLYSLVHILKKYNLPLYVITVNHYIRPKEETCGDALFVADFCRKLAANGYNVKCSVVELKPGQVNELAHKRQAGVEDAARFLRYEAFEHFINDNNLDFLCLAHNKNDQLETILMRFLQGSNVDSSSGICAVRGKYIRPLLNISRDSIEHYLSCQNISWCNDKTNDDTNYFRNNIRHNLIPFLYEKFPGWEKAVLSGAVKAGEDADVINSVVLKFPMEVGRGKEGISFITLKKADFLKASAGVQKRVLMKSCNLVGEEKRIPNMFLNDVIQAFYSDNSGLGCCGDFSKVFDCVEISLKKDIVFIKKYIKKDTDLSFFDIIEEDGVYDFPFGKLSVTFNNSCVFADINGCQSVINCSYPFAVRGYVQGDEIKSSSGGLKKVADIFSDWHVLNDHKNLIPVIYGLSNNSELCAVLGGFLGYKDWIVK